MKNRGVVLRKLRQVNKLNLKQAARAIGCSVGWLSEIENESEKCRIDDGEYQRILAIYKGDEHKKLIHACLSQTKAAKIEKTISYDGSILKYLRLKSKKTISAVAVESGYSTSLISQIEQGSRKASLELRDRLVKLYNYSPESFKNFYSRDKRALGVPARYYLKTILSHLPEEAVLKVFDFAVELYSGIQINADNEGDKNGIS